MTSRYGAAHALPLGGVAVQHRRPGRLTISAASANVTLVIPRVADPSRLRCALRPGRLTDSPARTNVVLLIRRTVRPA